MKSADIVVGQDLFWSKSNGWARGEGWENRHVRVVDPGLWHHTERSSWYTRKGSGFKAVRLADGNIYQLDEDISAVAKRGTYGKYGPLVVTILVDKEGVETIATKPWVALPGHLRGDWEPCNKQVVDFKRFREEGWKRAEQASIQRREQADKLRAGFKRHHVDIGGYGGKLDLSLDSAEALLGVLDAYQGITDELSNLLESVHRVDVAKDLVTRYQLNSEIDSLVAAKDRVKDRRAKLADAQVAADAERG